MRAAHHTENRELPIHLGPGERIQVVADVCEIRVLRHESGASSARCTFRGSAATQQRAAEAVMRARFSAETNAGVCEVRVAAQAESRRLRSFFWGRETEIEARLELLVPGGIELSIACEVGDVEIGDHAARLEVRTGAGNVVIGESGAALTVATDAGSVLIHRCRGPLNARVRTGNVEVSDSQGSFDIETGSGAVRLGLTATLREPCRVATGAGTICLEIGAGVGFELDADTTAGEVRTAFPLHRDLRGAGVRTHGRIGGGGQRLHLRTVAGDILCLPPGLGRLSGIRAAVAPSAD